MQPKVKQKTGKTQSKIGLKQKKDLSFPLEKDNFLIIGAGIILLVIGYILMAQNSVDGFVPTVISPILLFLGYCVVIPYEILKKPKSAVIAADAATVTAETANVTASTKANVKVN